MSRSIDGQIDGRRIVIPIVVLEATPSTDIFGVQANALLVTGSTASGITPRLARKLGLPKRGKKPIGSAQGEGQAERYLFRVGVTLSGEERDRGMLPYLFDDIVGFELADSFSIDALIGMDILSQCDFSMDRRGAWSLASG